MWVGRISDCICIFGKHLHPCKAHECMSQWFFPSELSNNPSSSREVVGVGGSRSGGKKKRGKSHPALLRELCIPSLAFTEQWYGLLLHLFFFLKHWTRERVMRNTQKQAHCFWVASNKVIMKLFLFRHLKKKQSNTAACIFKQDRFVSWDKYETLRTALVSKRFLKNTSEW